MFRSFHFAAAIAAPLIVGPLVAGPLVTSPAAAQDAPAEAPALPAAKEPSAAELFALEIERYRRLTVPVTIGGKGPYRFMIDTGAQATVLSRDLADQLELFDRDTATLVAMASTREVETTAIDQFALGSREFAISRAPILEASHIGGADGILGLDSLQEQRVLFDFENSTLQVADADELGGNRGFDIVVRARNELGQLVIHRARIDGVDVAVIIDTGAQSTVGNLELQRQLRRMRAAGEQVLTDVNGVDLASDISLARSLDMGRAKISNLALAFTDSPIFANLDLLDEPAMVLGMSELKLFKRVAIDFATQRILFDLPRSASLAQRDMFSRQTGRLR